MILVGGFSVVSGFAFVFMYVWGAIISRIGEPDQSLLFWYLPVLFLGLGACGGGVFLLSSGLKNIKAMKNGHS